MTPRVLRFIIAIFHCFYIVHLFFGMIVTCCWYPEWVFVVAGCALTSAISWFYFRECPLTMLEQSILDKSNSSFSYQGSFVVYHLNNIGISITETTVNITGILFTILTVASAIVYGIYLIAGDQILNLLYFFRIIKNYIGVHYF